MWGFFLVGGAIFAGIITIIILYRKLILLDVQVIASDVEASFYKNKVGGAEKVAATKVQELEYLQGEFARVKEKLQKEISRNKSVEVRTGFIMEKLAPFLEVFKHDPNNVVFIGKPIDMIVFNEDEIVFIEVKTGKSQLITKQRNIKKLIKEGKVKFETVRFGYTEEEK